MLLGICAFDERAANTSSKRSRWFFIESVLIKCNIAINVA